MWDDTSPLASLAIPNLATPACPEASKNHLILHIILVYVIINL